MAKIGKSLGINAAALEVFPVANDWSKALDSMENFTKFEPTTEKEEGAGSRVTFATGH